ncbi:cellulose biosynthesis protein BcsD [Abyssibacter profundi]|uniref:Cellulose synthase n=1 Tax=Abyssibacter profundi TaxID=2182787 RepID=A0A363UN82_9GAMM|nr:cellulose biosynthesis protein BcsD [Abyssibacter profundi]PWN56870.1 cellulose synthase [Abyssibacter profundi]
MSNSFGSHLAYFSEQQCGRQWRAFLGALAEELAEQMSDDEIQSFMYVLGRRMGESVQPAEASTLEEMEAAANAIWADWNWGLVRFKDVQTSLEIIHDCAPFRAAFGAAGISWSGALLEGIYSRWFEAFGAGDDLVLRQIEIEEGEVDSYRYRLAHRSLFG